MHAPITSNNNLDLPLFQPASMRAAMVERDKAMQRVEARAERVDVRFPVKAQNFVICYLSDHWRGEASSEEITDAAKKAGIIPPDDRAFGPVFMTLVRAEVIEKSGICARRKGHGTSGGNIWRLKR